MDFSFKISTKMLIGTINGTLTHNVLQIGEEAVVKT